MENFIFCAVCRFFVSKKLSTYWKVHPFNCKNRKTYHIFLEYEWHFLHSKVIFFHHSMSLQQRYSQWSKNTVRWLLITLVATRMTEIIKLSNELSSVTLLIVFSVGEGWVDLWEIFCYINLTNTFPLSSFSQFSSSLLLNL